MPKAEGTFEVVSFAGAELDPPPLAVTTGLPVGVATMEKRFTGAIEGRASTLFTAAFDPATGVGTYVALESFEGTVDGIAGAVNVAHSATTHGSDRTAEHFVLVPGSGTEGLKGITGKGGLAVDPDGTHRIWFDYELPG